MIKPTNQMTDAELDEWLDTLNLPKLVRRKKPDAPPKPPAAEQRLEERCAAKPIEAKAQDVALASDALAQSLHDERVRRVVLSEKERDRRQYLLDMAYAATRRVQQEISLSPYRGMSVGQGDSDYHLHQSPEDQLWGTMK